jgi:hypothetical protein
MTAESNANGQGSLQLYTTPPGSNIDGPLLAGAAISADPTISKEISLLNQQGSRVELGNLVTVPLDQTLLYVEPLYVASATNSVPQLDDVIVVYNGRAYNSGNASLDAALCGISNPDNSQPFTSYCNTSAANRQSLGSPGSNSSTTGGGSSTTSTTATSTPTASTAPSASTAGSASTAPAAGGSATTLPPPQGSTVAQLLANAQSSFTAAKAALAAGDLAGYQNDINQANSDVAQAGRLQAGVATTTTTKPGG